MWILSNSHLRVAEIDHVHFYDALLLLGSNQLAST